MIQPFSPEHLKRYLLLYVAVIVIMVLFYLLNTIFNPATVHPTKSFEREGNVTTVVQPLEEPEPQPRDPRIRLLPQR